MRSAVVFGVVTAVVGLTGCGGFGSQPGHTFHVPSSAVSGASGGVTSGNTARPAPTRSSAGPATPPPTATSPDAVPPYIARVEWVQAPHGRSLHIYPTTAGRHARGADDDATAWWEVLRIAPDAGSAGMRAQFECHWTYARLVEPDKTSWNIEPWRPVVTGKVMTQDRCNPGGPD